MATSVWQQVASDVLRHVFDEEDSKAWQGVVDGAHVRVHMRNACRREVGWDRGG